VDRGTEEPAATNRHSPHSNTLMKRIFIFVALVLLGASASIAQQGKTITVTTTDPASVTIEDLFKQADLVAFVEVLSGDSENYDQVLYKARVIKGFKGAVPEQPIYFGPFISYGIGSEYLVFLRKGSTTVGALASASAKSKPLLFDSNQLTFSVMYEGYSVMPVRFECVFEKAQQCDYGVKLNTRQVILPKELNQFHEEFDESGDSARRFVKRKSMEAFLRKLESTSK